MSRGERRAMAVVIILLSVILCIRFLLPRKETIHLPDEDNALFRQEIIEFHKNLSPVSLDQKDSSSVSRKKVRKRKESTHKPSEHFEVPRLEEHTKK